MNATIQVPTTVRQERTVQTHVVLSNVNAEVVTGAMVWIVKVNSVHSLKTFGTIRGKELLENHFLLKLSLLCLRESKLGC